MALPPPSDLADLALVLLDSVTATASDVALTVEVLAYYPDDQTADVRLAVQIPRMDPDSGEIIGTTAPTLYRRPVMWPRGAGMTLVWGLEAGDLALGIVRSRSHDEVDSGTSLPVTPASTRRGLSDLVVVPCMTRPADALPSSAFRGDGQPVLVPGGSTDALHVGASTATLRLVIAEELRPYLVLLKTWLDALTLPVAGATAGPPAVASPSIPAQTDLASGRIKVDT